MSAPASFSATITATEDAELPRWSWEISRNDVALEWGCSYFHFLAHRRVRRHLKRIRKTERLTQPTARELIIGPQDH